MMTNGNWQSELVTDEDREMQRRRYLSQPFGLGVDAINTFTESAKMSYAGGKNLEINIEHPFASTGSWIRAIPEEGATYVGVFRADQGKPQPVNTIQRAARKRINNYGLGQGVYRPLYPGELEMSSRGLGQIYLPRRPKAEMRGGLITRFSDQDKLIAGDRAPTHTKELFQKRSNVLGDEHRLGLVSRPKPLTGAAATGLNNIDVPEGANAPGDYSSWELIYPKVRGDFAAEEYLNLINPQNEGPSVLFTAQRGHVLDANGEQILQTRTQIPLRYREEYFANDDSSTISEIDEKGNVFIQLASAAQEGYELNVPAGNYIKTVELDENITINGNQLHATGQNMTQRCGANYFLDVFNNITISSQNNGGSLIFDGTEGAPQIVLATSSNQFFIFDDTPGAEKIYMQHAGGAVFTMQTSGSVLMQSKLGATVALNDDDGSLTVTSPDGSVATFKDTITISDSSGGNIISMNGTDTIQISAAATVNVSAGSVTIGGGSINLGAIAPLSVALAEPLAALFDAHIHSSAVGPTGPPIPPGTATLFNANPATSFASAYIKARTNLA